MRANPYPSRDPWITRRFFVAGGLLAFAACAGGFRRLDAAGAQRAYPVTHSDAEWRKILTASQYDTLRKGATERAFSSPLLQEKRRGTFICAGCRRGLFPSRTKFESGTGWPSFWAPLKNSVVSKRDLSLGMAHTEILCARCGGHLGHVFKDGPPPTGLRYCVNGDAMLLEPLA